MIRGFLDASPQERFSPADFNFPAGGTRYWELRNSGIQTVVLKGDPDRAGVYTIMLRVPAHTQIQAHSHRDDRVATVTSGTWHIGYGHKFDKSKQKALPPGSFYTEPPGETHSAETGDEAALVQITGYGPSSTDYVNRGNDPRAMAVSQSSSGGK
ncbi:cupin domain-containing protein [Occallatibacter riparius]|uniref:Cupin domain-containing protein n=1 Tax=Occallatibacter riparius TaxID=1002689 RepID=A0A9J7BYX3_9BACT|nr:cupin domain-containing protein [Occallatibacter riparius]UWZ86837.1 cupin domain-containing protein [Occallatibacter riparius]